MANAKIIVLESLDGGGKTTQCDLIKKYFEEHGLTYAYIHFPIYDNNEASKVVAAYLRGEYGNINEVDPVFVANIYAMDRYLYLPTLKRQLMENHVILLDRYVFSNMAFQGAKYITDTQSQIMRDWINEFEFGFLELPYPDLNIFFDVPMEFIKERLNVREQGDTRVYLDGKKDIHEADLDFQERVRDNYLALKGYQNYQIVPCAYTTVPESSKVGCLKTYTPEQLFGTYKKYLDNVLFNQHV